MMKIITVMEYLEGTRGSLWAREELDSLQWDWALPVTRGQKLLPAP